MFYTCPSMRVLSEILSERTGPALSTRYIIVGGTFMDLRPLHDRILVKRLEEGEQKSGGIIIPDSAKEKPQQGEVKAVGNGRLLDSVHRSTVDVKSADRI